MHPAPRARFSFWGELLFLTEFYGRDAVNAVRSDGEYLIKFVVLPREKATRVSRPPAPRWERVYFLGCPRCLDNRVGALK